jgi:hypothetical protein
MRLHVESTAASSTCGKEQSSAMAAGQLASGMASFSRMSTGVLWMDRPMATILLFGSDA